MVPGLVHDQMFEGQKFEQAPQEVHISRYFFNVFESGIFPSK